MVTVVCRGNTRLTAQNEEMGRRTRAGTEIPPPFPGVASYQVGANQHQTHTPHEAPPLPSLPRNATLAWHYLGMATTAWPDEAIRRQDWPYQGMRGKTGEPALRVLPGTTPHASPSLALHRKTRRTLAPRSIMHG